MKVIVIGSSTGGPKALEQVLYNLPADLKAMVIVLQHLPAPFSGDMARRLDKRAQLNVTEMSHGEVLKRGHIYVAPGNTHFFITDPGPKVHLLESDDILRPSINMGFTSVAEHFGPQTIGVMLTGMGDDGLVGAAAIKQVSGYMITQDESTSAVFGMPRAVEEAGLSDEP